MLEFSILYIYLSPALSCFSVVYCDYTASGRSLQFLEDYIVKEVLPCSGDTRTSTSICSLQSSLFRWAIIYLTVFVSHLFLYVDNTLCISFIILFWRISEICKSVIKLWFITDAIEFPFFCFIQYYYSTTNRLNYGRDNARLYASLYCITLLTREDTSENFLDYNINSINHTYVMLHICSKTTAQLSICYR